MFNKQQLEKRIEEHFSMIPLNARQWIERPKRVRKVLTEQKENFLISDRYICLQQETSSLTASWSMHV